MGIVRSSEGKKPSADIGMLYFTSPYLDKTP